MKALRLFRPYGIGWIVLHVAVIAGTFLLGYFARFE